jgi:HEPN domain
VRWNQGREVVERMLADRQLQQLPASREHADRLMAQARRHLLTAQRTADQDPEAAYAVLYDAARKALVAILENQGLRPTSGGGHVAVLEAVTAQLDPPLGPVLRPFDRMRRRRRDAEYPPTDAPELTGDDVLEDVDKVEQILQLAERVLDQMSPF